jgi:hypothetical protein
MNKECELSKFQSIRNGGQIFFSLFLPGTERKGPSQ